MDFHLNFSPQPLPDKIRHSDDIFLIGSCFTEHMTSRLAQHKFRVFENPHGILFNPMSICQSLNDCLNGRQYQQEDLFEDQGIWLSWDFHSRFAAADPALSLQAMNASVRQAAAFLQKSRWIVITLGSAFVYQLADGRTVANCHKVPAQTFRKRMLQPEEVLSALDTIMHKIRVQQPGVRFLYTISPVRHAREGLVENNRSKAVLIHAVHHLSGKFDDVFYFPAYELVIDDLRDYRFFAEDMVHPNYAATAYVWEKFVQAAIHPAAHQTMKDVNLVRAAMAHKPLHPDSRAHREFLDRQKQMVHQLMTKYPGLSFDEELAYFSRD